MTSCRTSLFVALAFAGIFWSCVLGLQRPPPRYSQQYMPDTSFTCRNKIVGSYYADPETDCQLFHVCVSVAGTIQDYRFLCPNDTAFDQESQTCADWYDVDCEAATLYYASDNFDLYRIGSGLESLHYDSLRSDAEPQDHLQRSESNDPVRSQANALNRVAATSFKDNSNNYNYNNNRKSSSSSKDSNYETDKSYRQDLSVSQDSKKKSGIRKISRKQQFNENSVPTTTAPQTTKYYSNSNSQRTFSTTTARPTSSTQQNNAFNRNLSNNNYNAYTKYETTTSTYRPTSTNYPTYASTYRASNNYQDYSTYQTPSTTAKTTTSYNSNNSNNNFNLFTANQQSNFGIGSTARPSTYSAKSSSSDQSNYSQTHFTQSTTPQPPAGTNYFPFGFQQRSYSSVPRVGGSSTVYPSTTVGTSYYDSFQSDSNIRSSAPSSPKQSQQQQTSQTAAKHYSNSFLANGYAPTTYSPVTKKAVSDNGQYYEKTNKRGTETPSTRYYDTTEPPKKATKYNTYDKSGKYFETSTGNYDFGRSSAGIGFSPSSINHLAESLRTTTPVPRRAISSTTYSPNNFDSNTRRSSQVRTTLRGSTYVSDSARPFSTTVRFSTDGTTPRPKSTKKNDYDYAYYDNAGPAEEYDALDLEHVAAGNKESAKIARN